MMNESAVTPIATIAPAIPGRFSAKPTLWPRIRIIAHVSAPAATSEAVTTRESPR